MATTPSSIRRVLPDLTPPSLPTLPQLGEDGKGKWLNIDADKLTPELAEIASQLAQVNAVAKQLREQMDNALTSLPWPVAPGFEPVISHRFGLAISSKRASTASPRGPKLDLSAILAMRK